MTKFSLLLLLLAVLSAASASAAEPIPLRAGPLSMVFEPDAAFLRYITLGPDEVLRGISAPVRDQFWATVPPQVKIVSLDRQPDRFELKFDAACRQRDVDFLWHGTIQGSADGTLEYTFDGESQTDFKRNRIGFCLLHGESAAGRPWVLETPGGEKTKGSFPEFIAPNQPAKNLRAVAHEFAPGRIARVQFEGEVFEMEDQRNWTDASFKTYCTPLALPFPVLVAKGTKVFQKITVTLEGDVPKQAPAAAASTDRAVVMLTAGKHESELPGIGLQTSSQVNELSATESQRLKALHLDHLRAELTPADDSFSARLSQAISQAKAADTKLIVGVHLGKNPVAELQRLAAECQSSRPPVAVWLVIGADRETFVLAREVLKPHAGTALIGIGQDTNFTELNRNRPDPHDVEAVSYGLNPQVHAFDNGSMIETLPIQGDTVRSARNFLGTIPLLVSPVTLRVQALNQQPLAGELPANVDPRQSSLFAAGWTVGSIKYLSESSASRITYYETVGRKGIMAARAESAANDKFPARPGEVYPIYHVLDAVGEFAGGRVQQTESTAPRSVVGLAMSQGNSRRLLVANLTDQPQSVALGGFGKQGTIFELRAADSGADAAKPLAWAKATADPVPLAEARVLPPFGIVKIDWITD